MKPKILRVDEENEYPTEERCHILELSNSPADEGLSIARARVEPGVTTALHRVADTVERYVILSGSGRVEIEGLEPADVGTNDIVIIPASATQRITNTGDIDLVFLAVCTPRFEPDSYEHLESSPTGVSSSDAVREMYDSSAQSYSEMMDSEIDHPMYADILKRLQSRLENITGMVIDSPCGSGHMLSMYHEICDGKRALFGVDLSPQMVEITQQRLGAAVETAVGDIRQLTMLADGSAAAVISHFAFHHLDLDGVNAACREWQRVLVEGGQLVIGAWEGSGTIDYGGQTNLVAVRHASDDLQSIVANAGFDELNCKVEFDEEMGMNAVYIEATRKL